MGTPPEESCYHVIEGNITCIQCMIFNVAKNTLYIKEASATHEELS